MKKLLIISLFSLVSQFTFSQNNRVWATYYGGVNDERTWSVTTNNGGDIYLAGHTTSDTGIASGGFQNTYGGGKDLFLVKFNSAGNRIWATYYGGHGYDLAHYTITDDSDNVYLSGSTGSSNGIAYNGFKNYFSGDNDALLVKFDNAGNRLWATYYGNDNRTDGTTITTDLTGNVYLAGATTSVTGIASGGVQNAFGGGYSDAYIVKFDAAGNRLWATYYGGTESDEGRGVATDSAGNVYLAGITATTSGMAFGGFQNTYGGGGYDALLVKFDATGNRLWATYYGGAGYEDVRCMATDPAGNVYLAGYTTSPNAIASGGFQNVYAGGTDAYLVKFDKFGNRKWATYYGGSNFEMAWSVVTDAAGNVYLGGDTYSSNNIANGGFHDSLSGSENQFIVKFDSNGNRLCSTYYGHALLADCNDGHVSVDKFGNVFLQGNTKDTVGIASGGFQNNLAGGYDAYLVKFTTCYNPLNLYAPSFTATCQGHCNGSATAIAIEGIPPYSYRWNTIPPQNSQTATGLCAGIYYVTVTDNAGNSDSVSVIITEFPNPVATITIDSTQNVLQCNPTAYSYQWYFNNNIIPGATDQTYTPTQNGSYTVEVKDSIGCTTTSTKFGVSLFDISEFQKKNLFIIFPDPSNNNIILKTLLPLENAMVFLLDVQGKLLMQKPLLLNKTTLDISSLARGMYFIKVMTEKEVGVRKFVKN